MTTSALAREPDLPFPDGTAAWLDDSEWGVIPADLRSTPLAWHGRMALAVPFDDVWLREQTFTSHPIGTQARMRYGRWLLLRLGTALSMLGVSPSTVGRLRNPKEFATCTAELDFGLFLLASGLDVQHEPYARRRGPDFQVFAGTEEVTFEVKSPGMSVALMEAEQAAILLMWNLQALFHDLKVQSGWFIEPSIGEARLAQAASDPAEAERLATALRTKLLSWSASPTPAELRICHDVSLSVRRREGAGVQLVGPSFAGDALYETRRLVRHLEEAADQIRAAGHPGFVVLADNRNSLLCNHTRELVNVVRADRTNLYSNVAGLIAYSVEASTGRSRLVSRARVFLKQEYHRLQPMVHSMRQAGEVSLRLF